MQKTLNYYYGVMGVGKSDLLIKTIEKRKDKSFSVFSYKEILKKNNNLIQSRNGSNVKAKSFDKKTEFFFRTLYTKKNITDIYIDECQFLTHEQVYQLSKIADKLETNVHCYGLRTDFRSNLFEGSEALFCLADNIKEIDHNCFCGKKAVINARIDNQGKVIKKGLQIDTDSKYTPYCRLHWISNDKKKPQT